MFLIDLLNKKKYNPIYEEELINKGVKELNKSIRLLVIADTHGRLIIDKGTQEKLEEKCDICCILGDVRDSDYEIILKKIPKDKIAAILGNHDRFSILNEYGIKNYHGLVITINDIKLGFFQGSHKYKEERFPSFTHERSIVFLNSMPDVDILLSHDKPFTIDYKDSVHDGLKGITKYLYERRVPINIHGHIHKNCIEKLKNGTQVKSVYGIELIEIKNGIIIS